MSEKSLSFWASFWRNLFWLENNILHVKRYLPIFGKFPACFGFRYGTPLVSVGQPNDSKAISFHRAHLTYDTSWALPSKVVYSSRSAYILSMGGPNGNWSSYPDSAGADICSTHQATQKMKSLTLAALVLGSTHWAPWEIEFLTQAVAALIALPKGLQNCRISQDRSFRLAPYRSMGSPRSKHFVHLCCY